MLKSTPLELNFSKQLCLKKNGDQRLRHINFKGYESLIYKFEQVEEIS